MPLGSINVVSLLSFGKLIKLEEVLPIPSSMLTDERYLHCLIEDVYILHQMSTTSLIILCTVVVSDPHQTRTNQCFHVEFICSFSSFFAPTPNSPTCQNPDCNLLSRPTASSHWLCIGVFFCLLLTRWQLVSKLFRFYEMEMNICASLAPISASPWVWRPQMRSNAKRRS